MNEDDIGLHRVEYVAHTRQHAGGNVVEVLPLLHDVEVVVGRDVEDAQHLVEHFAVLSRNAHDGFEFRRVSPEFLDHRRHFYRLRSRAENQHHFA